MNAGERLDQHGSDVQEAGFQGRVLARRAFAVVFLGHDDRTDALFLVSFGYRRDARVAAVERIEHRVRPSVETVDGSHQQVVRNVFEMASEPEPRAGHRDVVRRAFARGLNQQA